MSSASGNSSSGPVIVSSTVDDQESKELSNNLENLDLNGMSQQQHESSNSSNSNIAPIIPPEHTSPNNNGIPLMGSFSSPSVASPPMAVSPFPNANSTHQQFYPHHHHDSRDFSILVANYRPCVSWRTVRDRIFSIYPNISISHVKVVSSTCAVVRIKGYNDVVSTIAYINSYEGGSSDRIDAALISTQTVAAAAAAAAAAASATHPPPPPPPPPPPHPPVFSPGIEGADIAHSPIPPPPPPLPPATPQIQLPQQLEGQNAVHEDDNSRVSSNNDSPNISSSGSPSATATTDTTNTFVPPPSSSGPQLPHLHNPPPPPPPPPPPGMLPPLTPHNHPNTLLPMPPPPPPPPQFTHHPPSIPHQFEYWTQDGTKHLIPASLIYFSIPDYTGYNYTTIPIPVISQENLPKGSFYSRKLHSSTDKQKLFIGNIPYTTQWQDLKDFLRAGANIFHVELPLSPTNKSMGYAIATFYTEEDAAKAITIFNGAEFNGRELSVNYTNFHLKNKNNNTNNGDENNNNNNNNNRRFNNKDGS